MKRKGLSAILAAAMALSLFTAFPPAASADILLEGAFGEGEPPFFFAADIGLNLNEVVFSTSVDGAYIDLRAETITLPEGFTVAAHSLNGGQKWNAGPVPGVKKLLSNEMTLWLTNKYDGAEKMPAAGGVIIRFPGLNARPKKNIEKLKPFYGDDYWTFARKGETEAVFEGYEYVPTVNGKTPAPNEEWDFMPKEGIDIGADKVKRAYLIRSTPSAETLTPAGAAWLVRPLNYSKPPKFRIKRVNDPANKQKKISTLNLRKGDQYKFGRGDYSAVLTLKATFEVEELAKMGMDIRVRKASTGKKPPSMEQVIWLSAEPNLLYKTIEIKRPSSVDVDGNPVPVQPKPDPDETIDYFISRWDWVGDDDGYYQEDEPFFINIQFDAKGDFTFEGITQSKLEDILWPLFPGCTSINGDATIWDELYGTVAPDPVTGKYSLKFTVRYQLYEVITDLRALGVTDLRPRPLPNDTFETSSDDYFKVITDTAPYKMSDTQGDPFGCWSRATGDYEHIYTHIAEVTLTANKRYQFDTLNFKRDYPDGFLTADYTLISIDVSDKVIRLKVGYTAD